MTEAGGIRIKAGRESVRVIDPNGKTICYLYYDDLDEGRRQRQGRWTRAEAIAHAQMIARAFTGNHSPFAKDTS